MTEIEERGKAVIKRESSDNLRRQDTKLLRVAVQPTGLQSCHSRARMAGEASGGQKKHETKHHRGLHILFS